MKNNIKKIFMLMLVLVAALSFAFAVSAEDGIDFSEEEHQHSYSEAVTVKATLTANGKIEQKCSCGDVKSTEVIYSPEAFILSATAYTYDGAEKTPALTIKDIEGNVLNVGTDYAVGYENGRTLPGKYLIKIIFRGKYEGVKYLNFTIAPCKVTNIVASPQENIINLTWNRVAGATGYRVYQYNTSTKKWVSIKTTTSNIYRVQGLKSGTVYYYLVKPYTTDGSVIWGANSATFKTMTTVAGPAVKATQSASAIALTWNKVGGATGYRVYQYNTAEKKWVSVKTTTANAYTVKNLKTGTAYAFLVRPYAVLDGKVIWGANSPICYTATKPVATSKIIYSSSTSAIALKWAKVPGVTHYRIYQKTANGWKHLAYTSGNTYTIKGLAKGTNYTFAVKSCIKTASGIVQGAFSQINTVTDMMAYVAKTDGGLKLYPITSKEAKAIYDKWGNMFFTFYEAKNNEGRTLIYAKSVSGWQGSDINGATYDTSGNIIICSYCGKVEGQDKIHCDGGCHLSFS